MKQDKNFQKRATNWIAEQLISIRHDEIDIIYCQKRIALIKREIKLAKENTALATKAIGRYTAGIKKGEYGDEYKDIKFDGYVGHFIMTRFNLSSLDELKEVIKQS